MITALASLAALVFLSSAAGSTADVQPPDLERASLAVTDGIVGGFVGRVPRVRLAAGYDRVERGFHVVRRRSGPGGDEVWVAELEPEEFRALLELAVSSGLAELPLEDPPSSTDVYGRNCQIRLEYGDVRWANGAPGGCVHGQSAVTPTEEQRRRFDEVVARLEQAVDGLPLLPGSGADLRRIPFLADVPALDTYRRVMDHVLSDPVRHTLDLERLWVLDNRVAFLWRGRAPDAREADVELVVDGDGAVRRASSPRKPSSERFTPVETGATLADVLARLGEPSERERRADGSLVVIYRKSSASGLGELVDEARLRFEDGRVSAP